MSGRYNLDQFATGQGTPQNGGSPGFASVPGYQVGSQPMAASMGTPGMGQPGYGQVLPQMGGYQNPLHPQNPGDLPLGQGMTGYSQSAGGNFNPFDLTQDGGGFSGGGQAGGNLRHPLRVLLADTDVQVMDQLPSITQQYPDIEISAMAVDGQHCIDQIVQFDGEFDVVVAFIDLGMKNGVEVAREIRQKYPNITVVLSMSGSDSRFQYAANNSGAMDILTRPFTFADFARVVKGAYQKHAYLRQQEAQRRAAAAQAIQSSPIGGLGGAATQAEEQPMVGANGVAVQRQRVVAVYSPKGGVGTSFIAANLACAIAAKGKALAGGVEDDAFRTALVDFDFGYSNLDSMLYLPNEKNLYDMLQVFDEQTGRFTDENIWKKVMVQHPPTGLDVLLGPVRLEQAQMFEGRHVAKVIEMLRKHYAVIVLDTTTDLRDSTLTALELADVVLMVVTQDINCIRDTIRVIEALQGLGDFNLGKIRVVLNKVSQASPVTVREINENLKFPKLTNIPKDDLLCETSILNHQPLVLGPVNPVQQGIMQVAAAPQICPAIARFLKPITPHKKPGLLSGLLGSGGERKSGRPIAKKKPAQKSKASAKKGAR